MKVNSFLFLLLFYSILFTRTTISQEVDDKFIWLEEVDSEQALNWVKEQNDKTVKVLTSHPEFENVNKKILDILNSKEKIAYPNLVGKYVYNFWQDEKHARGIWRRTFLEEYIKGIPNWEIVLDLDELSKKENEKWAYKGATFLYPEYNLCMLRLSRGGGDAVEIREFDLVKKEFVEDGFKLPQAKGSVAWIDKNTLIVSTNFGNGTTNSGYPKETKIWKRNTELKDAKQIYETEKNDMGVWAYVINTPKRNYTIISNMKTFYTSSIYTLENDKLIKLDIPEDANISGIFNEQLLVKLKSDWNIEGKIFKQGSLISTNYNDFINGKKKFITVYSPDERSSLSGVSSTENYLLINELKNVKSNLSKYKFEDNKWISERINTPEYGTISVVSTDEKSDNYFFQYTNFLTPTSLFYVNNDEIKKVTSLPEFFDGSKYIVEQYKVKSSDGVEIPYFIVHKKNLKLDGNNPTLLYAYGGFEIPMRPSYSASKGIAWFEKGGVYVVANIRGGGEFGPTWHQAALKENRQIAFDDFYAVSQDLIDRKITSPKHLGIMGGSNGGLLVGVAFTQRPDLYNAVVCAVPLLDMKRYNKLLAGASWMGEYGNPDIPEEWEYISKYSPYQNLKKDVSYPKVFFTTTTRDDRVHPAHARKMAAKMNDMGHEYFYFENMEGGHGSGVTNDQRAFMISLEYIYLLKMLK